MAKRDAALTARNQEIARLSERIDALLPVVLKITGHQSMQSLNATYGGKYAEYIDIRNAVIGTSEEFVTLYFQGFLRTLEELGTAARPGNRYYEAALLVRKFNPVRDWLMLFLERTFLRNYDALSKARPADDDAVIWIGQNRADYGLLITPRFRNGQWENDKSEIRHFKSRYWSVGHVVQTGLVVPSKESRITFSDIDQYLEFFQNVLVRNSGSPHEMALAERYCAHVRAAEQPQHIPLLIPELRYGGAEAKHEHRLDFAVINPFNMTKVGFELSPWSTHGELKGIKDKTQKAVNEEAKANFEKEMKKLKAYFRKFGITILVYTDTDLADGEGIFNEVLQYLTPTAATKQLEFQVMKEFMSFDAKGHS